MQAGAVLGAESATHPWLLGSLWAASSPEDPCSV